MYKLLFLTFFISSTYSRESADNIEKEFFDVDKLSSFHQDKPPKFKIKREDHFIVPEKDYRVESSFVRTVHIPKGTRVFKLDSSASIELNRSVVAKIYRNSNKSLYSYLLDKKGKIRYVIFSTDTTDLAKITDITTTPDKFTYRPPNEKKSIQKKKIQLLTNVMIPLEIFDTDYLSPYTSSFDSGYGVSSGLSLSTYLDWNFIISPGIKIDYRNGRIEYSDRGDSIVETLGVGASFSLLVHKFSAFYLNTILTAGRLLTHNAKFDNSTTRPRFSGSYVELGGEVKIPQKSGYFLFGLFFKNTYLHFDAEINEQTNFSKDARNDSSFSTSATVGFQFDLAL